MHPIHAVDPERAPLDVDETPHVATPLVIPGVMPGRRSYAQ